MFRGVIGASDVGCIVGNIFDRSRKVNGRNGIGVRLGMLDEGEAGVAFPIRGKFSNSLMSINAYDIIN